MLISYTRLFIDILLQTVVVNPLNYSILSNSQVQNQENLRLFVKFRVKVLTCIKNFKIIFPGIEKLTIIAIGR